MDKKSLAELVHESVAPGENPEDFSWMVDALMGMERGSRLIRGRNGRYFRTAPHGTAPSANRAWFLCLLVKPKPPEYMAAMHEFRLALAGVARDERLRSVFRASIRERLLWASPTRFPSELKPSLYFDLDKARTRAEQLGVDLILPADWY